MCLKNVAFFVQKRNAVLLFHIYFIMLVLHASWGGMFCPPCDCVYPPLDEPGSHRQSLADSNWLTCQVFPFGCCYTDKTRWVSYIIRSLCFMIETTTWAAPWQWHRILQQRIPGLWPCTDRFRSEQVRLGNSITKRCHKSVKRISSMEKYTVEEAT